MGGPPLSWHLVHFKLLGGPCSAGGGESVCYTCTFVSTSPTWAGTGGLVLKMPGGKKCEQRGEMRGCQRKEDRNSQASRGGPWQPLRYCSGKGVPGPQRARSTGLPLEEGAGRQWGPHVALHQVGSVKVSRKCPVCSKTREGIGWAGSRGGRR